MKKKQFVVLKGTAMVAVCLQRASACDSCGIYASTEAQGNSGKGFLAGIAEQYTYFNTFQSGGHNAPNPDAEHLNSLTSQIFAGYNFNNWFGLQFNLPVIYREYGAIIAGNAIQPVVHKHGSELGIGDATLFGNLRLFHRQTMDYTIQWNALAGVKFPTGNSSKLGQPDFAAGIGGHDLALGSGSFDGLIGTEIFLRWSKAFLTASSQYAIRSEGSFDYQYANDLSWNGGPGVYLALTDDYTLSCQAIVSGETKGEDTSHGVPTDDTAETSVYLGPQINFTWGSRWSASVSADLPVSIVSTGEQIVPTFRIHAAVTFRF